MKALGKLEAPSGCLLGKACEGSGRPVEAVLFGGVLRPLGGSWRVLKSLSETAGGLLEASWRRLLGGASWEASGGLLEAT